MSGLREALEEPAYLAFARANTKANQSSGPDVVKALIERIDRDAKALATILTAHPDDSVTEWGVRWAGSARHNARPVSWCGSKQEADELRAAQAMPHMWETISCQVAPWQVTE